MSANIVGRPAANEKILTNSTISKEVNGLVTLVENYLIRASSMASFIPNLDVRHSAYSTATTKYSNMLVESSSVAEQFGNLATISVQFSGLLSTTLPKPVVRFIPFEGTLVADYVSGYVGKDGKYSVKFETGPELQIEFIRLSSEAPISNSRITSSYYNPSVSSETGFLEGRVLGDLLPQTINGTKMPWAVPPQGGNLGYVLMSEISTRRGGAVIIQQSYRKVILQNKFAPASSFLPPVYVDDIWNSGRPTGAVGG